MPYSSLESVIEQSKEAYYLSLRQTQGTIRGANPEWTPWLVFFLGALQRQMLRLKTGVEREKLLIGAMPELAAKIVQLTREQGRLTMADAPLSYLKTHSEHYHKVSSASANRCITRR